MFLILFLAFDPYLGPWFGFFLLLFFQEEEKQIFST